MQEVEIMAPAGSFESLQAAIKAGADSIYFGIEKLNMRRHGAKNFTLEDMKKIAKICEENNVRSYLALNTIIYDNDIDLMKEIVNTAKENKVSAIIAADVAVLQYAKSINQEVHSSTQLNISNIEAIKFYAQYTDVIVLARELTLDQITQICSKIKKQNIKGPSGKLVQIEIFCHGALCVSISGKCYMSLANHNASANRGQCYQTCRRPYKVIDEETGDELRIDNKYIMSPKDLCTIQFLDKILESGVSILKIEGRARPPEYVYTVTKTYKQAIQDYKKNMLTKEKTDQYLKDLKSVYNRGFWHGGYYLGKKLGEWSGTKGSKATTRKILLGKVKNYYKKTKIAHLEIISQKIQKGDNILITGPTTGVVKTTIKEIYNEGSPCNIKTKGKNITIPIKETIRENDSVFLVVPTSSSS